MNNKVPQVHLIFDRRKVASTSKQGSVEILVCYNYKKKYISTGIRLYVNQWKRGKIVNCANIIEISQVLDTILKKVLKVLHKMLEEGNVDLDQLSSKLQDKKTSSFLQFCQMRANIRKYGKEKDTQERYERFLRLFSEWGRIQEFSDVTDDNIILYDKYLKSKGMTAYSKWNNYHRFLDGFIRDAIDEGLIGRNPYKWVNIDKKKVSCGLDKCLTPLEFGQLKKANMPTESLERVRDLFVFQTYTCLRYSDLAKFNTDNITIINGTEVYKCTQKKTKKPATIPLLQPALDILDKYKGVLPIISNVKYNAYLKIVAQAAGLEYKLSTHWARHTGATILLNEGVDMKIVTKICGHSSIKITEQIYAKLLDETIVEAVDAVKHKL